MKEIPLTRGKVALVDDDDFERVNSIKWYAFIRSNTTYAAATVYGEKTRMLLIHRLILRLNFGDGKIVDHIDSNGLNNQKSNLRICSKEENARHRKMSRKNKTGFPGVRMRNNERFKINKYEAYLRMNKKYVYLGIYPSPILAFEAYKNGSLKYFKEFSPYYETGTENRAEGGEPASDLL